MQSDSDAIATALRARIQAGRLPSDRRPPDALPVGATLPTVNALAEAHGVNRTVAHEALVMLRTEGLILTARGRPARVASHHPAQVIRWDRYRRTAREDPTGLTTYHRQVEASGWRGRVEYINVGWVPCPAAVLYSEPDGTETTLAELLGTAAGHQVVERRRLRHAAPLREPSAAEVKAVNAIALRSGQEPAPVEAVPDLVLERVAEIFISYVPAWVVEAVEKGAPPGGETILTVGPCGVGGSYSRIERDAGIPIDWITERILFRSAEPEEAEAFDLARPEMVLELVRVVESRGDVVTVDRCVHRITPQVQLVFGYPHTD